MNSRNCYFNNRLSSHNYYSKESSQPKSDCIQVAAYLAERNPSTKFSNLNPTNYGIGSKLSIGKEDNILMPNSTTTFRSYSRPSSMSKENPRKISEEYTIQKGENVSEFGELSASKFKHTINQSEITELKKKAAILEQEIKFKDEKLAQLEAENKLLKSQLSQVRLKKPSQSGGNSHVSMHSYSRNLPQQTNHLGYHPSYRAHGTRSRTYFGSDHSQLDGTLEESKTESRPEGVSEDEWKSIQLAIRLESENRMMHRNQRSLEEFRARHSSQEPRRYHRNQGLYDPNLPLDLTNINPDNMTYEQLLQLGERIGNVSKGLSKEQLKSIPKYKFKAQNDETNEDALCTICYSQYEEATKIRKLKCTHEFHSKCIKTWLKEQKTCPICKIEVI